ncbi:MAG: hypothetical protein AAGF25_14885, partial [Pseudomonadota bacterium]
RTTNSETIFGFAVPQSYWCEVNQMRQPAKRIIRMAEQKISDNAKQNTDQCLSQLIASSHLVAVFQTRVNDEHASKRERVVRKVSAQNSTKMPAGFRHKEAMSRKPFNWRYLE